jgi:hypothetical protein
MTKNAQPSLGCWGESLTIVLREFSRRMKQVCLKIGFIVVKREKAGELDLSGEQ